MNNVFTGNSIKAVIARVIAIEVFIVVCVLAMTVVTVRLYVAANHERSEQTRALRASIEIVSLTNAIDNSTRNYAETGKARYLAQFTTASTQLLKQREETKARTSATDSRELTKINSSLLAWYVKFVLPTIELADSAKYEQAQAVIKSDGNERAKQQVLNSNAKLLAAKDKAVANSTYNVRRAVIVGFGLSIAGYILLITGSIALLAFMRKRIALPLADLSDASQRFGKGELAVRVAPTGSTEVVSVSKNFNEMAVQLERQVVELKQLDEMKSHFVSTIAHELRSPLFSIRGFLDLILHDSDFELSAVQMERITLALNGTDELEALLNDLITIASLEQGEVRLNPEMVSVSSLLMDVTQHMQGEIAEKEIEIDVEDPDLVEVFADPDRLRQILTNLLDNAIKFSKQKGVVTVLVSSLNNETRIAVIDHGIGISPRDLKRIGDRFYRAQDAGDTEGTGLGLAISIELLKLHHGHLDMRSKIGGGSVFTVRLPQKSIFKPSSLATTQGASIGNS
ncbi:MAG: HAMP domain-containing protein [Thermoleophilaceae bacterium]|nr:HAMP domain-containing protein [Thermoleophilaceae bacterium]